MTAVPLPLLRTSERKDLKTCEQQWDWAWNEGLRLKIPVRDSKWFGTGWHLVWAEFYTPPKGKDGFTRGREPHGTWDEFCKEALKKLSVLETWDELAAKEFDDMVALGHIMIDGYLKHYGIDPQWEVLIPEQRFSARIPFNARQKRLPLFMLQSLGYDELTHITQFVGTFDMPVRDHSFDDPTIVIVDHKTTGKKENTGWLTKDDQGGGYITVGTPFLRRAGFIGPKESIWGAIWSYARKGKPADEDILDDQGRKRNQPGKADYAEVLQGQTIDGVYYSKEELLSMPITSKVETKMTLSKLAEISGIRVLGPVSKTQPSPLFWRETVERTPKNRANQLIRIADDAQRIAMLRAGLAPVTKSPGEHCSWCPFKELCDLHENGDETDYFISQVYEVVDPYADHRSGALNSKASVANRETTGVQ